MQQQRPGDDVLQRFRWAVRYVNATSPRGVQPIWRCPSDSRVGGRPKRHVPHLIGTTCEPWMSRNAITLLHELLLPGTAKGLEWSTGSSTTWLLSGHVSSLVSIEHHQKWADNMQAAIERIFGAEFARVRLPRGVTAWPQRLGGPCTCSLLRYTSRLARSNPTAVHPVPACLLPAQSATRGAVLLCLHAPCLPSLRLATLCILACRSGGSCSTFQQTHQTASHQRTPRRVLPSKAQAGLAARSEVLLLGGSLLELTPTPLQQHAPPRLYDAGKHAQAWPPPCLQPGNALQVFAEYAKAAFVPDSEAGTFDFVSIDGRARVACFPRALQLLKPHGGVLVLDNAERPHYRWEAALLGCKERFGSSACHQASVEPHGAAGPAVSTIVP